MSHTVYWNNLLAKKAIEDVFAEFRCKTGANYILAPFPGYFTIHCLCKR